MNKQVIINNLNTSRKNCVIVSVGDGSLHRQLCYDTANFDLHLLVYDDTYNKYLGDSKFVCKLKGYKMDMSFQYFQMHPQFIEQYDYFLLLDDDIHQVLSMKDFSFYNLDKPSSRKPPKHYS